MSSPAITVENLSKAYRIGGKEDVPDTFTAALTGAIKSPFRNLRRLNQLSNLRNGDDGDDVLWALKDVSFEVNEGEVVGIIGRNGAGKSTLLKILSRITEPTSGRAVIHGRVSSLLEVGTGFHPELTGRENIYMNGTILGMTKREIDRKFDQIVEFSGVEKFLDTPTKRYSSGMQVRLAFSVAAHLEPEILIIDEVLAVGDAEFQRKCLGKMRNVADGGRTVLFVSHNMAAVESMCSRALMLTGGQVHVNSSVHEVVREYMQMSVPSNSSRSLKSCRPKGMLEIIDSVDVSSGGNSDNHIRSGDSATIVINFTHHSDFKSPTFGVRFETLLGECVFVCNTRMQYGEIESLPHSGTVTCKIPQIPLVPGEYVITCGCSSHGKQIDCLERVCRVCIEPHDFYGTGKLPSTQQGRILVHASWEFAESGQVET